MIYFCVPLTSCKDFWDQANEEANWEVNMSKKSDLNKNLPSTQTWTIASHW